MSSRFLLQASSGQSGYTLLVNTSLFPSNENSTPPASVERLVICLAFDPSTFMIQTCDEPPRSEMNAICLESGDHSGRSLSVPWVVIWRGDPPLTGTR